MIKRLFDIAILILLLPLCVPIAIVVALCVLLAMGRPILFVQDRVGLNGAIFRLYKFRTMDYSLDGNAELMPDEKRLTRFGKILRKSSLDELPQLINILRGDMSFVGPRPLLTEYLALYTFEHARRHEVKPGITGWAQVNGRNAVSWDKRFELDRWYVDNHTIWVDIKILIITMTCIASGAGISAKGSATMPKYRGGSAPPMDGKIQSYKM